MPPTAHQSLGTLVADRSLVVVLHISRPHPTGDKATDSPAFGFRHRRTPTPTKASAAGRNSPVWPVSAEDESVAHRYIRPWSVFLAPQIAVAMMGSDEVAGVPVAHDWDVVALLAESWHGADGDIR